MRCRGGWRFEAAPGVGGLTNTPTAALHTTGVVNEALAEAKGRRGEEGSDYLSEVSVKISK